MSLVGLVLADFDLMALEFAAFDEVVERLGRGLLAGENEIVAVAREPLDRTRAGEEIVGEMHRKQGFQTRAVVLTPALPRCAGNPAVSAPSGTGDEFRCELGDLDSNQD